MLLMRALRGYIILHFQFFRDIYLIYRDTAQEIYAKLNSWWSPIFKYTDLSMIYTANTWAHVKIFATAWQNIYYEYLEEFEEKDR